MPRRSARSTPSPRTTRAQTAAPQSSAPAPTPDTGSPSTPTPDPSDTTLGATTAPGTSTAVPSHGNDADGNADATHAVQQSPLTDKDARELAIIDALERGTPYREIAQEHHVSFTVIADIARRMSTLNKESVVKFMQIKALDALNHWATAMETGAKMGKHAPARDLLIHAKMLDPIQSDASNGAKVAIIIGQVGNPLSVDVAQVIDAEAVSSDTD